MGDEYTYKPLTVSLTDKVRSADIDMQLVKRRIEEAQERMERALQEDLFGSLGEINARLLVKCSSTDGRNAGTLSNGSLRDASQASGMF